MRNRSTEIVTKTDFINEYKNATMGHSSLLNTPKWFNFNA